MNIVPSDSPGMFEVIKTLSTLEQQAVIRPNNPPPGIAGFLFDIVGDESIELTADITDHFTEDNDAIQDQVALRPERITVRGLVAELTSTPPKTADVTTTADPLPPNPDLLPVLTPYADQVIEEKYGAQVRKNAATTSAQSLYNYYDDRAAQQPNQTKQSKIFGYFFQLWKSRQMFTVVTPYGAWTNMAILTLTSVQTEETKYVSDITIVFKKMRFAKSVVVTVGQLAGRAGGQRATVSQNGVAGLKPATTQESASLLYRVTRPSP